MIVVDWHAPYDDLEWWWDVLAAALCTYYPPVYEPGCEVNG